MKTFLESSSAEIQTVEEYFEKEKALITELADKYLLGATVKCTYGTGTIVSYEGNTFEEIIINVDFKTSDEKTYIETKRFSLYHILLNPSFVSFENEEVIENSQVVYTIHLELMKQYKQLKFQALQDKIEAEKKAEADRKAEKKYLQQKDASIKAFDKLASQVSYTDETEEFYYMLGWLATHAGSVTVQMPDYLEDAFNRHFGPQESCRIVDSKKRTSNGNSMQYTFSFNMTLKKVTEIPTMLQRHMNATGKSVASTSFIWILIDSYGFRFGKKQDVNEILKHVPSNYIQAFENGRNA